MPETRDPVAPRSPARRTIVKGAAWAVPAVTIASAAPAMAASPEPGLNGWVVISRENYWDGGWRCRIRYDGYRDGDDYYGSTRLGLWVWDSEIPDITTTPSLTIHLPYQVSWTTSTGNSGWPAPTYVGTDSGGNYMYRSIYAGTYTQGIDNQGRPEVVLNGRPHFIGTSSGQCPSNRYQAITRSVGVRGETLAFKREVYFPQNVVYYEKVEPETEANSEAAPLGADVATQTASPDTAQASESAPTEVETEEIQYAVG